MLRIGYSKRLLTKEHISFKCVYDIWYVPQEVVIIKYQNIVVKVSKTEVRHWSKQEKPAHKVLYKAWAWYCQVYS